MNVLVLVDAAAGAAAKPDDADALVQADAVRHALRTLGHHPTLAHAGLDLSALRDRLRRDRPDLVFNLTESLEGHARLIAAVPLLLESLGVPFTGCTADAQHATSNKLLAKRLLRSGGLPTPAWATRRDLARVREAVPPGRYILKSTWEHASVGLDDDSVIDADAPGLARALDARWDRLSGDAFAEAFIEGREFNLALLADPATGQPQLLPPAEIEFVGFSPDQPRIVGYRAKWDESSYEYHHTPRRFDFPDADAPLLAELAGIAQRCWTLFSLTGYARVDVRVDHDRRPWVLEVNTNPCLSPDAGFAAALAREGLSLTDAVDRILRDADARRPRAGARP